MLDSSVELIDAIDESGHTIGVVERRQAYVNKQSHRVVHVMVEKDSRLLVVRRSLKTRYLPGFYCTSAGGHVLAGENFEAAAARELEEEIGLAGELEHVDTFWFEHEFRVLVALYVLRIKDDRVARLNADEVLDAHFYTEQELEGLDRALFHPQLIDCLKKTRGYLND